MGHVTAQGLAASRRFRCAVRGDPRPGRSAFDETLGPIGARFTSLTSSAGGPIAARKRSSSFLATAPILYDAPDPCSLFVIPRGGAHLSVTRPGRRRMRNLAGKKIPGTGPVFGTGGGARTGKGEAWGHTPRGHLGVRAFSGLLCPQARKLD